ncbi:MAG: serine/threonine protein kinase [Saprospiraceae bacterium]|nr:serine/threonine protein kinase [Saprospiraceae bacterium]
MKQGEIFHNRYYLNELVGNGGFSQVWKSQDMQSGLEVAVKIFSRQDEEGVKLCRKEFSKTYQLRHGNILTPMHFDVVENIPYLVMPYITGGTLEQRIGNITKEEIYKFIDQIGSVLKYIHHTTNPVIHGDIKPDNILIDSNGNFLLTDFGISTELKEKFTQTMNMEQLQSKPSGITPMAYRAPELNQYKDWETQQVSQKSDIWSAGVVLFNLCTGKLPFNGDGGLGQLIMMRTAKSENVTDFLDMDHVSSDLQLLISRCLQLHSIERSAFFELSKSEKKPISQVAETNQFQKSRNFDIPKSTPPPRPKSHKRELIILLLFLMVSASGFFIWVSNYQSNAGSKVDNLLLTQEDDTGLKDSDGNELFEENDSLGRSDLSIQTAGNIDGVSVKNTEPESKKSVYTTSINSSVTGQKPLLKSKDESNNSIDKIKKDEPITQPLSRTEPLQNFLLTEDKEKILSDNTPIKSTGQQSISDDTADKIKKEITEPKTNKSTLSSTKVASNIPIKLALKSTIPVPHNLQIGNKVAFIVLEDVMGQSAVFLKKNSEVEATVRRASDDKITIEFPHVYSEGNTKIKTYRSRFDISGKKNQENLAVAQDYKVVIYTNELIEVKL